MCSAHRYIAPPFLCKTCAGRLGPPRFVTSFRRRAQEVSLDTVKHILYMTDAMCSPCADFVDEAASSMQLSQEPACSDLCRRAHSAGLQRTGCMSSTFGKSSKIFVSLSCQLLCVNLTCATSPQCLAVHLEEQSGPSVWIAKASGCSRQKPAAANVLKDVLARDRTFRM